VRKLVLVGALTVLVVLLYGRNLVTSEEMSYTPGVREDNRVLVDLSHAREETAGGQLLDADHDPTSGGGKEEELAYQEAVASFVSFHRDTIDETNPLVHALLMHSRGADRMTEAEVAELDDRLSDLEDAPEFGAVESYPEGYEDCSRDLGVAAVSLNLAADSIRGFNRTSDLEYLKDYRGLIGMYLQAVADAQSCVADHLYPAYP
jgi:hypothetical protein